MNLDELKRLAGINDALGNPVSSEPINISAIMRENNIQPGTDQWFRLCFPTNKYNMPPGFRGRKK